MKTKQKILFNTLVMLSLMLGMAAPAVARSQDTKAATQKENTVTAQVPDGMTFDVSAPVTPKLSRPLRDLPMDSGTPAKQGEINQPKGVPETRGTDTKIRDPLAANSLNNGRTPDPLFTFEGAGDLKPIYAA